MSYFEVSGIGVFFAALTALVFALSVPYGAAYLKTYKSSPRQRVLHWVMLAVCFAGLLGLYFADNLLVFLVAWEFMAAGSFFAVIFEGEKPAVLKAGLNYFVQSHIGVVCLSVAFVWVYSQTGSWQINAIKTFWGEVSVDGQTVWLLLLMFGFGFKAGLFGMHTWLPQAHPAAPSHVSALMSGVIVKAGVYGVLRFGCYAGGEAAERIGWALLAFGIVSALCGIAQATRQRDIKKMLAYCTIENIGIIFCAVGIFFLGLALGDQAFVTLGFAAALMHTLNHAVFKVILFWGAGAVYTQTHTRNMEQLGGVGAPMPRSSHLFCAASAGIAGLPPLGSFFSELLLYMAFLHGMRVLVLGEAVCMVLCGLTLALVGGAALMCFARAYGVVFLGATRKKFLRAPQEVGAAMLAPQYLLAAVAVAVALFPNWLFVGAVALLTDVLPSLLSKDYFLSVGRTFDVLTLARNASVVLFVVVSLVVVSREVLRARRPNAVRPTWGCGYQRAIEGIQYTASSFSASFAKLFSGILPATKIYKELTPQEIFPPARQQVTLLDDTAEIYVTRPATNAVLNLLNRMDWLMNGRLQRYIVYGLVTVALLVVAALM